MTGSEELFLCGDVKMNSGHVIINDEINVLIVDDDKVLCKMLEDMLSEEAKLKVTSANNGLDAIEKIKGKKFDLILTDLMMPGANGIEVLRTAKEIDEGVHVVIVTGFASLETAVEAVRKGAYDYITKPFKLDEIRIVVQNASERIRLLRQNQTLIENLKQAYKELDTLKKSREELSVKVEKINQSMDESQERLAENIIGLQTVPSDLPVSYYLRRRRTDKACVLMELEKLGKLRDEGILTEEEFRVCKNRFLSEI
ncbi:MAG: response regulator [Deltaproteobacteria bacterium]|nr:response regulator [Deltaproteobacteria bacterium]